MGWKKKETKTAELLSQRYGLRACEIIQKRRFISKDDEKHIITIIGKEERTRTVHIIKEDYQKVIEWYEDPKTICYKTLWNRIGKTHQGRKDRYACLPKDAAMDDFIALAEELGHGLNTAMKHYNRTRIEEKKKNLLNHLPR